MTKTPFKFLDSYTKEDKEIFFGREKEIEELHYKIFESNLLIVYGSSGTGKTSLIQCGLAGKFNDADWMPIIIRRGNNINDSIKKTLENFALTPLRKKNKLPQNLQSIYLDHFKPMFVLFDQFEELFIFGSDEEIEQFVNDLKASLDAGLTCRFVFVLRGEYLENIARFEDVIPDFFNNRMRIERMTRKNAVRAITEPAAVFNIKVAEDFPGKALDRLSSGKGSVELTYLQVYLDKLYRRAIQKNPESPEFNIELIEETGHIDDVLANFLDEQIAKTANPETGLDILKAFVSNEGTKKQMSVAEVREFTLNMGKGIPPEDIEKYVRQFIDLRILKEKDENDKYELRHDALAKKIFDQITYSEKELIEVRQFILNRYNDFKSRGTYLQDTDVQYIRPYEKKLYLSDEQKDFVAKSIKLSRQKRVRRRNIITGITATVMITLICFSVYAMKQRDNALDQSLIAQQKTQEAMNQKAQAEKAQEDAMKASKEALSAEEFAKLQKNIADDKSKMAEEQKIVAEREAKNARTQSEIASRQKDIAEQQRQTAETEKAKAETEREKAKAAEKESNRLRLVALSQSLAFQALQVKNNPQLCALLGCLSYNLCKENGGNPQDAQIFNALHQGYKGLVESYPVNNKLPDEPKATSMEGDKLAVLCADGSINYFSKGAVTAGKGALDAPGLNTAYLSRHGRYAVTAFDDFSFKLWDIQAHTASPALTGHTDFIRTTAFSEDGSMIITGGRDSSILVWTGNQITQRLKAPSRVKALSLSHDKLRLIAGCEDGMIYQYSLAGGNRTTFASLAPDRIENVCFSNGGKYVVASSSNGGVSVFEADGSLRKNLLHNSPVDYICTDYGDKELVIASRNHIVRVYDLNDLLQKPIEIAEIKSKILGMELTNNGTVYITCANNTVMEYNIHCDALHGMVYAQIQRNLTGEEWTKYLGKDIPYKKINPNLD